MWLLSDRESAAGDNGEALFKYLQSKDVNSIFAISKSSPDYKKMAQIGKVVEYDSLFYKFLLCVCDVHLSSQMIHMETHRETFQVFLQHGVTMDDMHSMINPASHENFYIVVSGRQEYESMAQKPYILKKKNILLTGLPRFDYRKDESEKKKINHNNDSKTNSIQVKISKKGSNANSGSNKNRNSNSNILSGNGDVATKLNNNNSDISISKKTNNQKNKKTTNNAIKIVQNDKRKNNR